MAEGMGARCASFNCESASVRERGLASLCGWSFFLPRTALVEAAVFLGVAATDFFLGGETAFDVSLALVSVSHAALLRGAALRLLCHSLDPWSPAISARLRLVSAE